MNHPRSKKPIRDFVVSAGKQGIRGKNVLYCFEQ